MSIPLFARSPEPVEGRLLCVKTQDTSAHESHSTYILPSSNKNFNAKQAEGELKKHILLSVSNISLDLNKHFTQNSACSQLKSNNSRDLTSSKLN